MIPPTFETGRGLLALIDVSGWAHRAFAIGGIEGMLPIMVGSLAKVLAPPHPACCAVAMDSTGATWRHVRTAAMPERERYKAGRERKPREFYSQIGRFVDFVGLHAIPVLWSEGYEADDVIAAAVIEADGLGLDVAIITADKDLAQMVTANDAPQRVVLWDGNGMITDARAVHERFGVDPGRVGDVLAILGDAADNVRGVHGIGEKSAALLMNTFSSLVAALEMEPVTDGHIEAFGAQMNEQAKKIERLKRRVARLGTRPERAQAISERDYERGVLVAAREQLHLAKLHRKLVEARATVELARELITLDTGAPLSWDVEMLPVGSFNARELTRVYQSMGMSALARAVRHAPKPLLEEVLR